MNIRFTPVSLTDLQSALQRHLASLPSDIDSFFEDHIVEANLYQIHIDEHFAGFTAVHRGSLVTQFSLEPAFRRDAQSLYAKVKKLEQVQAALVPTNDEFFLSHALDEYRLLAKQAYLFGLGSPLSMSNLSADITLSLAEPCDIDTVRAQSGNFFDDIAKHIRMRELFLVRRQDTCVGFGVLCRSMLCEHVASIGMYVREEFRRQGAGSATIRLLQAECQREGRRPVAGCWYYNHRSKQTLEKAGMITQTRLLRIEY